MRNMQRPWEAPRAECVDDDVTRLSREQQRKRLVTVPIAPWKPSQELRRGWETYLRRWHQQLVVEVLHSVAGVCNHLPATICGFGRLNVLQNRFTARPFVAAFVGAEAVAHGQTDHVIAVA